MDKGVRNTLLWTLGFIALVLGLFLANFLAPRQLTEAQYREMGYFGFPRPREVAEFQLISEEGEAVNRASLAGDWTLVFFGFTFCPDVCPTTLAVTNQALANMSQRGAAPPQVLMVTVDPERDTPEQIKAYVEAFNPAFTGYTGEFDELVKFATSVNVAFGKVPGAEPGTYTMDHTANLIVLNPAGHYVGFIKQPHRAEAIAEVMTSLMQH